MSFEPDLDEGRLERDLDELRRQIPVEAAPPPGAWARLQTRLWARPARGRWRGLAAAAAALIVFGTGFAAGSLRTRKPLDPGPPPMATPRSNPAEEVQRAGTAYVVALAAFSSEDPRARQQVRDAGLSAIYGATVEIGRLAPEDPVPPALEDVLTTNPQMPAVRPVRF